MLRLPAALLATLGLAVPIFANDYPAPGLYALTGTMTSDQLPIARTHNSEQCLKDQEFVKDPRAWMRKQPNQDCEVVTYELSGGKINMELSCEVQQMGRSTIIGTGTYTSDSFTMTNQIEMQSQGMTMKISTTTTGKRQGSC